MRILLLILTACFIFTDSYSQNAFDTKAYVASFIKYRDKVINQIGYNKEQWTASTAEWDKLEECEHVQMDVLQNANHNFINNGFHYDHFKKNVVPLFPTSGMALKMGEWSHLMILDNPELIDLVSQGYLKSNYPFKMNIDEALLAEFELLDLQDNEDVFEISMGNGTLSLVAGMVYPNTRFNVMVHTPKLMEYYNDKLMKNQEFINMDNFAHTYSSEFVLVKNTVDKLVIKNTIQHIQPSASLFKDFDTLLKEDGEIFLFNYLVDANCNSTSQKKNIIQAFLDNGYKLVDSRGFGDYYLLKFQRTL